MNFQEIVTSIWELNAQHPCHLPGWWLIVMDSLNDNYEPTEEEKSVWPSLQELIRKVSKIWLKKLKKWEVTSLTTFLEKISTIPGDILATSFPTTPTTSFINLWTSYANMENIDETECLDTQSKMITSTSSTIVPTVMEAVDVAGGSKLSLSEKLNLCVRQTNSSAGCPESIGTMSSSISLLERGELVKYGLEEKVGKHRLTVSKPCYIYFL